MQNYKICGAKITFINIADHLYVVHLPHKQRCGCSVCIKWQGYEELGMGCSCELVNCWLEWCLGTQIYQKEIQYFTGLNGEVGLMRTYYFNTQ